MPGKAALFCNHRQIAIALRRWARFPAGDGRRARWDYQLDAIAMLRVLGSVLFERTKRSVAITPAGAKFLLRSEQMLADYEAAVTELRTESDPQFGRVTIACLSTIASRILPSFVPMFRALHPRVRVRVHDDHPDGIIAQVKSGAVDMAISCMFERDAEVRCIPLMQDKLRVVRRKDHPLVKRATIGWADLERYNLIAISDRSGIRLMIDRSMSRSMLFRSATYEVARVPSVLDIVESGASVSVIPALALAFPAVDRTFHHRPINDPEVRRRIDLIVARSHTTSLAAQAFQIMVIDYIASLHREPYPGVVILGDQPMRQARPFFDGSAAAVDGILWRLLAEPSRLHAA